MTNNLKLALFISVNQHVKNLWINTMLVRIVTRILLFLACAPLVSHGQDLPTFDRMVELKNYVQGFDGKSEEVRVGEITAPLDFPIVIDGEKLRFLGQNSRGRYLTTENLPTGKRYSFAHIQPSVGDITSAQSINTLLIALCGKKDIEACWSLAGAEIDRSWLTSFHQNIFVNLRYVYDSGELLNFINVAFVVVQSPEALEKRLVVVKKVMMTSVNPKGLHPEMDDMQ